MRRWLSGQYKATLFALGEEIVAYALWREQPDVIQLRHFFVIRGFRRLGLGRQAMRMLVEEIWSPGKRVRVEVLVTNAAGVAFWRSVGFRDYALTLEREPTGAGEPHS